MKIKLFNQISLWAMLLVLLTATSCKKYLDVPLPNDQIASETAFTNKAAIDAVMTGMYNAFAQPGGGISMEYVRFTGLFSDEGEGAPQPDGEFGLFATAGIRPDISYFSTMWNYNYTVIYRANNILENLPGVPSTVLTDAIKKQYAAAARFVRAACHFNAVKTWGDVPVITSTNVKENGLLPRKPVSVVYASIVTDLQAAITDLPASTGDVLKISNKYVAEALLARVYLQMGKWPEAEAMASDVINSGLYLLNANLLGMNTTSALARGSKEIIFAMGSTATSGSGLHRASIGSLTLPGTLAAVGSSRPLAAAFANSFEPGDKRAIEGNWIITLFGNKYSNKYWYPSATFSSSATIPAPQDYVFLRLAEQYLIRSEARAQQTNINGAAADINTIRTRAGLAATTATDKPTMLTAIEEERKHELFFEGYRWYDLVRTGRADAVLGSIPYKSANWKPHFKLWPVPQRELLVNPSLVQNPGY